MSGPLPGLTFEVEGVGSWPVLELVQKTPTPIKAPPLINDVPENSFVLTWRESGGVLYMDAIAVRASPPRPTLVPAGPAELEVSLPAGVQELAVLTTRADFAYRFLSVPGGMVLGGRAIAVALKCECPRGGVPGADCRQARLYLVVVR